MESFGVIVDDKSRNSGGNQCVITPEGYIIPIHIHDGLPRIDMCAPTNDDMSEYPHVFITSNSAWDPSVLDC